MTRDEEIAAIKAQKRELGVAALRDYPIHGTATPNMRYLAHRALHFQAGDEALEFIAMLGLSVEGCDDCAWLISAGVTRLVA